MYTSREFWRNSTLEQSSSDRVIEEKDKYILVYSKQKKFTLQVAYLEFESVSEFVEHLDKLEDKARLLEIPRISLSVRKSDKVVLADEVLNKVGFEKKVELSRCGVVISNKIIAELGLKPMPRNYSIRRVDYDEIDNNSTILNLINNNFPDAFASSPEMVQKRLQSGYESGIENNHLQRFYIVEYQKDNKIIPVGFAKSSIITEGSKKGLLHLVIAVTAKNHRYKGLYKNLLKVRIEDGMKNNAKFAYTEADVSTSGPILERLGLEEFELMKIYHKNLSERE